ncbi:MAG: histidine phosphatase family protein [Magnetococcales bacterium]|nr:histidine phosphatase family protein [Magnetococcales bacterium]
MNPLQKLLAGADLDRSTLLMRHGARPKILDASKAEMTLLTPEGIAASRLLGKEVLAHHSPRALFHSTVPRCRQTLLAMMEGMAERAVYPENRGGFADLAAPYLPNPQKTFAYSEKQGWGTLGFIRHWFEEGLPADYAQTPNQAAEGVFSFLKVCRDRGPGFQVHVSHDWNIILLAWNLLQISPSHHQWPQFLEGILITFVGERVVVRFRDVEKSVDPWPE